MERKLTRGKKKTLTDLRPKGAREVRNREVLSVGRGGSGPEQRRIIAELARRHRSQLLDRAHCQKEPIFVIDQSLKPVSLVKVARGIVLGIYDDRHRSDLP